MTTDERLCALRTAALAQDPIGYGQELHRLLAIESPMPWTDAIYAADPDGSVRERIQAVAHAHHERLDAEGREEAGRPVMYGIAPDAEWSDRGRTRALLITRPEGAVSEFTVAEYSFPSESERLVDLVRAFFDAPEEIGALDQYRIDHAGYREFFVCTHGQVDVCCGKLGYPLYRQARIAYPRVRAWRMTHFGGHRFAPTAWEFPAGLKWAFLDEQAAALVLERSGHPVELHSHLRGWSGVPNGVQTLDRVGLERYGWEWLDFRRRGEVLDADEEARWWRVRLEFSSPAGQHGAFEGVVTVGRDLRDLGCGPDFGHYDYEVAEYQLTSLIER